MKIVRMKGGIGNQLFQYAFARRMNFETGVEVKLDTLNGFYGDFFERKYSLNNYNLKLESAEDTDLSKFRFYSSNYAGRTLEKAKHYLNHGSRYIETEKDPFGYEQNILNDNKAAYYDGYWQNLNYFNKIRELLLNDFSIRLKAAVEFQDLVVELQECESVAIHVRSPHAIVNGKINEKASGVYRVLDEEYYKKGVNYFKTHLENPRFYLFCEDENYALSLLKNIVPEKIIKNDDYIDLILLSRCKHQIIANSTFSWWGAWLNANPFKVMISPELWFNDITLNNDSLLKDFIKL